MIDGLKLGLRVGERVGVIDGITLGLRVGERVGETDVP